MGPLRRVAAAARSCRPASGLGSRRDARQPRAPHRALALRRTARSWWPCPRSRSTPRSSTCNRADGRGQRQYLGPDPYFDDLFLGAAAPGGASCRASASCPPRSSPTRARSTRCGSAGSMVDGVVEAPAARTSPRASPTTAATRRSRRSTPTRAADPERWAAFTTRYLSGSEQRLPAGGRVTVAELADICVGRDRRGFRGDGEILASPIGTIPMLGGPPGPGDVRARPAGDRRRGVLVAGDLPVGGDRQGDRGLDPVPRGVRHVWSGRRHVMMGASQIDPTATRTSPASALGAAEGRSCSACAARPATPSTTPPATGSRATRPGCSCRASTWCRGVGYDRAAAARGVDRRPPRDPPRRHQPGRARLRGPRPPHAARARCTRASPSTRSSRPPASSWSSPATCRRPAPRPTRSAAAIDASRPEGAAPARR